MPKLGRLTFEEAGYEMKTRLQLVGKPSRAVLAVLALTLSGFGSGPEVEAWKRLAVEPILSPSGSSWEAAGTFNPAVIRYDGKMVML